MVNNTINPETLLLQMRAMAEQVQGRSVESPVAGKTENFASLLQQSIDKVNQVQNEGNTLAQAFQKGDPNVQLSEVMVSLQKANVSFTAMVEVRNKLVSAYQEIMNMQV